MVGLAAIVILVLMAVFAPWVAPHNPTTQFNDGLTAKGHAGRVVRQVPAGHRHLGRDLLSRIIYGARASLLVGVLANGLALVLGVIFGLTAGFFRGWVETLIMRATDVMMAFPIFLFAIALVGGPSTSRASGSWCWSSASCTGRR